MSTWQLKVSPDDHLYVRETSGIYAGRWVCWSPDGEYFGPSVHGDELTDEVVQDWPGATIAAPGAEAQ